jgi:uncharacterized membrane protein
MEVLVLDWLNLLVRWFHVIAGIAWIGSSFYFMWLDASISAPKPAKDNVDGELWMVHSGGFYLVEKRKITASTMPPVLHWFKWEAAFTWISGIVLLAIVFYFNSASYLINPDGAQLGPLAAVGVSIAAIIVSWVVYDTIWRGRLYGDKKNTILNIISVILLVGLIYFLCHVFNGRAAYIHVGAILGTIMVANVWMRILPGQRKMIAATAMGELPDYNLGLLAKQRSVHNSYVTLPVVFMMISNHFPMTFGHAYNWVVLTLMMFIGVLVRHAMIAMEKKTKGTWAIVPAVVLLGVVTFMTVPKRMVANEDGKEAVTYEQVATIFQNRCLSCHSSAPTDDTFTVAPNGVIFETEEQIRLKADIIMVRVVDTKTMPLVNKTGMTDAERETIARWITSIKK